jgi:uncharacterized protein YcfJ
MLPKPIIIPLRFCAPLLLAMLSCLYGRTAAAQTSNVRTEYAQVLRVEPVYQTLRAYATEQKCDESVDSSTANDNCHPVRVEREFQRPVAYDVEYIHRGVKYRSRLPVDPGKRLRVKVSVTPDLPPGEKR